MKNEDTEKPTANRLDASEAPEKNVEGNKRRKTAVAAEDGEGMKKEDGMNDPPGRTVSPLASKKYPRQKTLAPLQKKRKVTAATMMKRRSRR